MAEHDDALAMKIAEIRTELVKWNRSDVLGRHRIGCIVSQIKGRPGQYGQAAVEQVARAIGYSASWVYACAEVAEAWDEQQLKEMLKERDALRGQPLTWSHLQEIASLQHAQTRGKWVRQVLERGLSVAQLRAELDGKPAAEPGDAGARPTIGRWIRDIQQMAEAAVSRQQRWLQDVPEQLASASLDARTRQEIDQALEKAREAKTGYEQLIEQLEEAVSATAGR